MSTPNFSFRHLPGNTVVVTWETDHAVIHDEAHARELAGLSLPGRTAEAAQAYLDQFYPEGQE